CRLCRARARLCRPLPTRRGWTRARNLLAYKRVDAAGSAASLNALVRAASSEEPMADLSEQILALLRRRTYQPLKPKALARKLGVSSGQLADFKRALRTLLREGRIELGKNHTVRPTPPHGTVTGTFRRTSTGPGFVRPHPIDGRTGPEVRISEGD